MHSTFFFLSTFFSSHGGLINILFLYVNNQTNVCSIVLMLYKENSDVKYGSSFCFFVFIWWGRGHWSWRVDLCKWMPGGSATVECGLCWHRNSATCESSRRFFSLFCLVCFLFSRGLGGVFVTALPCSAKRLKLKNVELQ